jgi:hypothetical protein
MELIGAIATLYVLPSEMKVPVADSMHAREELGRGE